MVSAAAESSVKRQDNDEWNHSPNIVVPMNRAPRGY
jgi:hypothetical protein